MPRPSKEPCKKEACDIQSCLTKNNFIPQRYGFSLFWRFFPFFLPPPWQYLVHRLEWKIWYYWGGIAVKSLVSWSENLGGSDSNPNPIYGTLAFSTKWTKDLLALLGVENVMHLWSSWNSAALLLEFSFQKFASSWNLGRWDLSAIFWRISGEEALEIEGLWIFEEVWFGDT